MQHMKFLWEAVQTVLIGQSVVLCASTRKKSKINDLSTHLKKLEK